MYMDWKEALSHRGNGICKACPCVNILLGNKFLLCRKDHAQFKNAYDEEFVVNRNQLLCMKVLALIHMPSI